MIILDVSTARWFSFMAVSTLPHIALLWPCWLHHGLCPHLTQESLVSWSLGLPRVHVMEILSQDRVFPCCMFHPCQIDLIVPFKLGGFTSWCSSDHVHGKWLSPDQTNLEKSVWSRVSVHSPGVVVVLQLGLGKRTGLILEHGQIGVLLRCSSWVWKHEIE